MNEQRGIQLEELLNGYVSNAKLESQVHEQMKNASGQSVKINRDKSLSAYRGLMEPAVCSRHVLSHCRQRDISI